MLILVARQGPVGLWTRPILQGLPEAVRAVWACAVEARGGAQGGDRPDRRVRELHSWDQLRKQCEQRKRHRDRVLPRK